MKTGNGDNYTAAALLLVLIFSLRLFNGLPWWLFVIPVAFFGAFVAVKKWKIYFFVIGFVSGFILWTASDLYFYLSYHGVIVDKFRRVVGIIALLLSGTIGGLLTGLSFYTGKVIASHIFQFS